MNELPAVGIFPSCTDRSMPIVDLARAAEDRGFTSIFLNEHTHLPVEHPRSAYPGGGTTPDTYARFWDPYVALAFVAAQTALTIGTAVSLIAEHDAIALAKATASLDVLSGGRLVLGVGWGWNREEVEDHGVPANQRAATVLEHVRAMRSLWTDDIASFAGDRVRFGPSWSWPKPSQQPHPPVLLGAPALDRNLDRVVEDFDGWIPMGPRSLADNWLAPALDSLRDRWAERHGEGTQPRISCIHATNRCESLAAARERAATLGVERVIVYMGELDAASSLTLLDRLAPALT